MENACREHLGVPMCVSVTVFSLYTGSHFAWLQRSGLVYLSLRVLDIDLLSVFVCAILLHAELSAMLLLLNC